MLNSICKSFIGFVMETFNTSALTQKRKLEVDVNKEKTIERRRENANCSCFNFGFLVEEEEGIEHSHRVLCCKVLLWNVYCLVN